MFLFKSRKRYVASSRKSVLEHLEARTLLVAPVASDDLYQSEPLSGAVEAFSYDADAAPVLADGVSGGVGGPIDVVSVQGYEDHGFSGDFLRNKNKNANHTTLTLSGLPSHESIDLDFLLAIIDSWDGTGSSRGPDAFRVTVDGVTVFSETFDNDASDGGTQSYSPPPEVELSRGSDLGFGPDNDAAYNMGLDPSFKNIPHTSDTLTVRFFPSGPNWTGRLDESFAIENLSVKLNGTAGGAGSFDTAALGLIGVLGNDTDGDGDPLTAVLVTDPNSGTVELNPDGSFIYTASTSGVISDAFTYRASDGSSFSEVATVTLEFVEPNTAPIAVDDSAVTVQPNAVAIDVLMNDSDADGDVLAIEIELQGDGGVAIVDDNNTPQTDDDFVVYTPSPGFDGTDSFTYRLLDGKGGVDNAVVSVTVQPEAVNAAPSAVDDVAVTTEGAAVAIDVLQNDSDPDGGPLTISITLPASNGQAVVDDNGTVNVDDDFVRYIPSPGFVGGDTFGYTVDDGNGGTDSASVAVTVEAEVVVGEGIQFPADSGVINIKQAPYNAKGDGVTDDTAAILQALKDWNANTTDHRSRAIYFPAGTYLVSDTLEAIDTQGRKQSNVRIHGSGVGQTIIKLADNASGYGSASSPKAVIATHGEDGFRGNRAYGNYIQHLTVDVGAGNPGAIGIDYKVSNWGSITHVEIRSSDPNSLGAFGVRLPDLAGPGYVKDLSVQGFDYAVVAEDAANNIVFEGLSIRDQRVAGVWSKDKSLAIRGLTSVNQVPAVLQTSVESYLVLIDSTLTGGAPTEAAIKNSDDAYLFARNITTGGYGLAIDSHPSSASPDVAGGANVVVDEWLSHPGARKLWDSSADTSFSLPIADAPVYHTNDFSKWANVQDFGATSDDNTDDSAAVQSAIDSGAEVIYFPFGEYRIDQPIVVRNNVKKIDFIYSEVLGEGQIEIAEVSGDSVILENLDTGLISGQRRTILHNSSKSLVLRHIGEAQLEIVNTDVAQELFIEDMGPHLIVRLTDGINAWIRQINREWSEFTNEGSTVWILGMNMEGKRGRDIPQFLTANGGVTEILGGAIDPRNNVFQSSRGSVFTVEDASFSVTIGGWASRGTYRTVITETRNGVTRTLSDSAAFDKSRRRIVLPLFNAGTYVAPPPPDALSVIEFERDIAIADLTANTPLRNPVDPFDVNASGDVSALDALQVIESMGSPLQTHLDGRLIYADVSGDNVVSAVDALRVINELARRTLRADLRPSIAVDAYFSRSDDDEPGESALF